jgi:hypothetical protein
MEFSTEFMIAMISSALFIDGKLDRRFKSAGQKIIAFQSFSVRDGEAVASGRGSVYRREIAFLEARYRPELAQNPNSLIGRIISLIT